MKPGLAHHEYFYLLFIKFFIDSVVYGKRIINNFHTAMPAVILRLKE